MKSNANLLVLCGAAVGGLLGYLIFYWCVRQGYIALALPGGFLGMGAGVVKGKSVAISILCGCAALALGIFADWQVLPFIADNSFIYFVTHLHQLMPMTLIMLGVGTFIGFWVPFRRIENGK